MRFLEIIGKGKPKNLESKRIKLKQAIEYAGDPRYEEYDFPPIDENNPQAGCIAVKRVNLSEHAKKLNLEFRSYVESGGKYKNIDAEVKNYNNYQSAKKYKPDMCR